MGYYSFYRIIKDILYNLKKNKILVVIAIIILVLFLCNKVFASYELIGNNITFSLSDTIVENYPSYKYFIIINQNWNNRRTIYGFQNENDIYYNYDAIFLKADYISTDFYGNTINSVSKRVVPGSVINVLRQDYIDDKSMSILFLNTDVKDINTGKIKFPSNNIKIPKITTSLEDLQTLNFDTISVSAWDWSNKNLYILFYDRTLMNNNDTQGLYPKKEIKLAKDTSYYVPEISSDKNAIYWVANDNTGLNFKVGGKYEIRLAERVPQSTGRWLSWGRFI